MAKQTGKAVRISLSKVINDRSRNVRENDEATYHVDALRDDIALRGQQTPAVLEKNADGTYYPLAGFLRTTALLELAASGAIDPNTIKRDPATGEPIPGTGKPFDSIVADVYEDLSDRERVNLLVDHGQRRGLQKQELFYAMERLFFAMYSEKEVAVVLRGLLEIHYPPNKKIENTAEALLQYYRGVIQTAKRAWAGPALMRNAWVEKLKGHQNWPTKAEMEDGVKIYNAAVKEDKTGKINRDNPGEKFMEFWNRLLKAQEQAEADGPNAPKSVSMLSRGQIEDLQKIANSRILKAAFSMVLNDGKVDRSKLPNLSGLVEEFEKNLTPEQTKVLDNIYGLTPAEPAATEPAATEPAAK